MLMGRAVGLIRIAQLVRRTTVMTGLRVMRLIRILGVGVRVGCGWGGVGLVQDYYCRWVYCDEENSDSGL